MEARKSQLSWVQRIVLGLSFALLVYMPLHVLLSTVAGYTFGYDDAWKSAKDVVTLMAVPLCMVVVCNNGIYKRTWFRHFMLLGVAYSALYIAFLLFDMSDDTYSAMVGTVFNLRLLAYAFIGMTIGSIAGKRHAQKILLVVYVVATLVALFAAAQYFLPKDLLEAVGYTTERGVKAMFFIDDKPDFPRVMGTLKDPNSLGAYLVIPLLMSLSILFTTTAKQLFGKAISTRLIILAGALQSLALFLTFSRGALLAVIASTMILIILSKGQQLIIWLKRWWYVPVVGLILLVGAVYVARDSYIIQNVVFHADESTVLEDPNELRVSLTKNIIDDIARTPLGHGPGSAGLVSISNPQGTVLTENYYLQIAYEVGWLGLLLFLAIIILLASRLLRSGKYTYTQERAILFAALCGYLFYSLLIHLWSNEAIALQWWLLTGLLIAAADQTTTNRAVPPSSK